jgi:hypothetical protein
LFFVSGLIASDMKSKAQAVEHRKINLKLFSGSFCRSEFCPTHERGSACLFRCARLGRTASSFAAEPSEHHRCTTLFVCGHALPIRNRSRKVKPKT